jgi:hypothetical protein
MDDYPEAFIRSFVPDPADAAAYRAMVKAIDAGAPEAECTVRMSCEGTPGWYCVHLMSVLDGNGRIGKAIGNVFSADKTVEAEKAIADERMRMESLRGVYLATANFNVTKDTETTFNAGGGLSRSSGHRRGSACRGEKGRAEHRRTESRGNARYAAFRGKADTGCGSSGRRFIRCCSHEGMLRLFREGSRDV